ncbi:MAG: hypothetical protein WAK31_24210 [Chthoniobacterales bacterium]
MAESAEDKDAVTGRLDQDREQLAIEAARLRRQCDVPGKLTASIQQDPVPWVIGATVTGFLLSLLPARRKKIYLARDSDRLRLTRKQSTPVSDQHPVGQKLWKLAKPLISTYVGQQIYKRLSQSIRSARSVRSQSL